MTDYRIIPDTVITDEVSATSCPVPPPEWGPGRLVRDALNRCWRFEPPPPPDVPQPPVDSARPILVGRWYTRGGAAGGSHVTGRMRVDHDRLVTDGTVAIISIRFGLCPIRQWDEPRDKNGPGELVMDRGQAEYLRDALTALLAKEPA